MRIYLDNCCYNRPFDTPKNDTIAFEASAKMSIQRLISIQQIDLASSVVLLEEIYNNPFKYKRERIMEFLTNAKIFVGVERFNYTEWRQEYFKDAYKDSEGTQLENFLDSAVQHFPKNSFGLDD